MTFTPKNRNIPAMTHENDEPYQAIPIEQAEFKLPKIDTFNASWESFIREREKLERKAKGAIT